MKQQIKNQLLCLIYLIVQGLEAYATWLCTVDEQEIATLNLMMDIIDKLEREARQKREFLTPLIPYPNDYLN